MTQMISHPAPKPLPRQMTYEEFLKTDFGGRRAEWVNGEISVMGTVSMIHAQITDFLTALIRIWCESRRGGTVFHEPFNMKTGPDLPGRNPDVLYVAPEHHGRIQTNHLCGPADLVVEVVSPDDKARDTVNKFAEYQLGGVREYWIIDPAREEASFYVLADDGRYARATVEDGVYHSTVLDGFWLRVDWLWTETMPPLLAAVKELGLV